MKILIEHDEHGNIKSIGLPSSKASKQFTMRARPGYRISEVEAPHIKDEQDHEHLRDIREHFQLDMSGGQPKLVRKQS